MPAKAKPTKSPKRTVRKVIRKAPPRATFSQEVTSAPIEAPVPQPPVAEAPVATPPPPVATPVENLEQILDSDTKDSVVDAKNHVVFAFGITAAVAIIIGAIVVFVVYLGSSKKPEEGVVQKTTPTASPTPSFLRSSVTFEVINASGVSGAATKAKDALEQIGYSVLSIGNGKKQASSSLQLASSLSAVDVSEILADTNSLFSIGSSSGSLTGTTASARIILGVK